MASEFMMPKLGLTMTEGTISKWFKAVGDSVASGEVLVEVETDKITNQLEAPEDGVVLEILVPEGAAAACQSPIAILGKPGETAAPRAAAASAPAASAAPAPTAEAPAAAPAAAPSASASMMDGDRIKASPIAKRLAAEKGVDLSVVTGTGPEGRIVERDVLAFAEKGHVKATPLAAKVAAEQGVDLSKLAKDGRITKDDVLAAATKPTAAPAAKPAAGGTPLSGMRKVIAERMSQSWLTAPHVNFTFEVDMTAAGELRSRLAAASNSKYSYTEIIVRCCAQALTEFPAVNSSLINGQVIRHAAVNVGVAVALPDGLIVPVVKNAAQKSVTAIRDDIKVLSGKARQGQLGPDDVTGGTFTISNLGMYGVDAFTPIINQPESAILGVCRIVDRPVVVDGAVVVRPLMNICLTCDHRLIDGAVAAQFMARIRQLLEQPLLLI